MKNKVILKAICASFALLTACSPIPDKPVSESLNEDEIAKIAEKDPQFPNLYSEIKARYDSLDNVDKERYGSLSIRRLTNFLAFATDSAAWSERRDKYRDEWLDTYRESFLKGDSILRSWEESVDTIKNLETKFVDIITRYPGYKKGDIVKFFDHDLANKNYIDIIPLTDDTFSHLTFGIMASDGYLTTAWKSEEFNDKTHPDEINLEQGNFWRWMEIGTPGFYRIENLTINGVVYPSSVLDRMPNFIQEYYFGEFPLPRHQVVAKIIAEENINSKYISQEDFIALKTREELVKRDKEAYEFFYESGESKPSEDVIEFVKTFYNEGIYDNTDVIRSYITDKLAYKLCKLYADIYGEGVIEKDAMATWEFTRIYDDYVPQTDDGLKDIKLGENGKVTVVLKFSGVKREINLVVIDTPEGLRIDDLETQDES